MARDWKRPKQILLFSILGLGALVMNLLLLSPDVRERVQNWNWDRQGRKVLSKVETDLTGQGDWVVVMKVKSMGTMAIEVLFMSSDRDKVLESKRIVLEDRRDGYFHFKNNGTSLALADLNFDGVLEILAPTFGENLIPHLNLFRFDKNSRDFFPITPSEIPN